MYPTTYYNFVTRERETYYDYELTDTIARQLIRQDKLTQDIYVYARRTGASIGEALSRALLEGRNDRR